ncbi:putative GPI mannosyltransferase [Plasmopara halstedii]
MKLYVALAVLRLIASVLFFGMIHPDEFFQSQEVMARHILPHDSVLRRELFVPWEFQLPNVNRSILFPALVVGVPYKVLELLGVKLTGWLLLVTPRVLLCLVSFLIDVILYRIVGRLNRHQKLDIQQKKQMQAILIFASSWTTLVFMCRPFSNTFETLVLALCFGVLYLIHPSRRMGYGMLHVQTILLGSLLAIGIFTRFTFPVFFFPLGVELVRQQDTLLMITARKKDVMNSPSILRRLLTTISILIQGFIAFVSLAALFVVVDTLYFHPELFTGEVDRALFEKVAENTVIAPYNNFLYNIQYENLKQHGVHPRLTHLIINMPILFGPVFLNYLVEVLRFPDCSFFEIFSVFFPLICLSLAPHQELRFLLPLVVPLHLFTALSGRNGTKRFLVVLCPCCCHFLLLRIMDQ